MFFCSKIQSVPEKLANFCSNNKNNTPMYKWEEKYSVGIQSIDNQHKELFKLLNSLLEAMKLGKGLIVASQIILELESFAIVHFQKEEFFFQRFDYSGAAEHISEHNFFIEKITTLKSELKSGKITLSLELYVFLKDWIERHILVVDKEYSECFQQNGLK